MGKVRKFCGVTMPQNEKCVDCPKNKDCKKENNAFTAKIVLLDCEGFYYVFKKLEAFDTYPRFDGNAEKHEQDWQEYEEKHKDVPFLTPTVIVNGTLAAELALKFLIFKENGEYECGHNLQTLFNQLPEPHKTVLLERIYKEAHQNADTLALNLPNISNLFEEYRYYYEYNGLGFSNFLNDFIHIVCDYAISLKSEYEDSE